MQSQDYWSQRYQNQQIGWDVGSPTTPIKTYIDQLTDLHLSILIPGAGNAYEAEYLWKEGYNNVHVLDITPEPLAALKDRVPDFPDEQMICGDFWHHKGAYDLILEQTFFCSFDPKPEHRSRYFEKMSELLTENGQLVGLWFSFPIMSMHPRPPFGGSKEEYLRYADPYFSNVYLEECYNSIKPRMGSELFGKFSNGR